MIYLASSRIRMASAAVLVTFALSSAALAQEITVEHAQGETTLSGVPEKVFAFDIASLDTLHALGVEVAGVPDANFPAHLSQYASDEYLKIGSLFEPDYELINAEQTDLVIVAARSSTAYGDLSAIAPTIDLSVDWSDFPGTIKERSETLGEIFDKQDEVARMIAHVDADMAAIQQHAPSIGNALIIMTNAGTVTAYGPGSRFGWLHDDLGIPAAIEDVEAATHGEAVSFEFLLETNPDWLFVIDRDVAVQAEGGQAAQQVLDNDLVHQVTAWQDDQIVYLDSVNFYVVNGGLFTLQQMVDQIGEAIGAELE